MIAEWKEAGDYKFASPAAPDTLARILIEAARGGAPADRLGGSRLFIALPTASFEPVRAALAPTGATVILFDPANPIPQRAETLQELGVS